MLEKQHISISDGMKWRFEVRKAPLLDEQSGTSLAEKHRFAYQKGRDVNKKSIREI